MLWAYLALLATFLYAIGNIIDKYVLTEFLRKPMVTTIISGFIAFVVALVISFHQIHLPPFGILGLLVLSGVVYFIANFLYFKAVLKEEISRVIPVFSVEPIFLLVLAGLFLGEILLPLQYLGIFLIIGGSILVSLKKKVKIELSISFFLIIFSTFLYASIGAVLKYCLGFTSFWNAFFWQFTGMFLAALIALVFSFKPFMQSLKRFPRACTFSAFNEVLAGLAHFIYIIALSVGFITLVSGIVATLPVFVLVFAVFLSFFKPEIIHEELRRTTLAQKVIAVALIIVGTFLLF